MVLITHPQNKCLNRDTLKYLLSYCFLPFGKINMFSSAYHVGLNQAQLYVLLFHLRKKGDGL